MYSVYKVLQSITKSELPEGLLEYKICCPFHRENTPSFEMNYEGKFICFGCGVHGGSLVNFIAQLYHVYEFDPQELCALDILANGEFQQVEAITYTRSVITTEQTERNLEAAKDYYRGNFHGDRSANKNYNNYTSGYIYMYSRGFLAKTLQHFHVVDWQLFSHHPLFLPLAFNGNCWGYQQRRICKEDFPKYLSMLGQNTSENIDGYASIATTIGLVVEGTFDKMMAWQYGWTEETGRACFAVIGSHVSEQQAAIMSHYCDVLLSGFDNDAAGKKAHQSLVKAMQPFGKTIIRLSIASQGISTSTKDQFWKAVKQSVR